LVLGKYPDVSLADARKRHADARQSLANGVDPGAVKKTQKTDAKERAANTFSAVFWEWYAKNAAHGQMLMPHGTNSFLSVI